MTRQDVIRRIVKRELKKQGLTEDVVIREATALHEAACVHFGTWDTALQYAGVNVRCLTVRDEFSADRVARKIRRLCLDGKKNDHCKYDK